MSGDQGDEEQEEDTQNDFEAPMPSWAVADDEDMADDDEDMAAVAPTVTANSAPVMPCQSQERRTGLSLPPPKHSDSVPSEKKRSIFGGLNLPAPKHPKLSES